MKKEKKKYWRVGALAVVWGVSTQVGRDEGEATAVTRRATGESQDSFDSDPLP